MEKKTNTYEEPTDSPSSDAGPGYDGEDRHQQTNYMFTEQIMYANKFSKFNSNIFHPYFYLSIRTTHTWAVGVGCCFTE